MRRENSSGFLGMFWSYRESWPSHGQGIICPVGMRRIIMVAFTLVDYASRTHLQTDNVLKLV